MDFALDDDQRALQGVLREFFADRSPEAAVRAQMAEPAGFDRQLWKRMSAELGLCGLAVPEEHGGAGSGFVELGLVLEEMGRALVVSPFLGSCVMAAQLALAVDATELLPGIASGETIASVGLAEDGGSWSLEDVTTTAVDQDGWHVRGHKSFVVDGHGADLHLVVARTPDGPAVFAVDGMAPGLTSEPLRTLDQTRRLARLTLDDVPARLLAEPARTARAVGTMLDRTAVALAADAVGGSGMVLDMAVGYAKVREQFGRPIGSFQAIKHKCATMLVELESSRAAAYYALWATAVGHDEASIVAPLVKAHCVDSFLFAAGENIQIHGGIGFTWEHPAHLYLKRAKSSQALLGSSDYHRQVLADRINL